MGSGIRSAFSLYSACLGIKCFSFCDKTFWNCGWSFWCFSYWDEWRRVGPIPDKTVLKRDHRKEISYCQHCNTVAGTLIHQRCHQQLVWIHPIPILHMGACKAIRVEVALVKNHISKETKAQTNSVVISSPNWCCNQSTQHLQKLAIAKNIQWTKKTWDHTGLEAETKKNDELDNKKYKWTHPFVLCSCQATNSTQNASGLTAFWTPSIWGLCGVWNYECLLWQYSLQLLIYAVLSLLEYHMSAIEPSLRRSSISSSLISHFWPSLPTGSRFLSQNFWSASVKRNSSRAFGMHLH